MPLPSHGESGRATIGLPGRLVLFPGLAGLLACLGPAPADAADLPDRPIRILVSCASGGSSDLVVRLLAEAAACYPRDIMVENRIGAGGNIGVGEDAILMVSGA